MPVSSQGKTCGRIVALGVLATLAMAAALFAGCSALEEPVESTSPPTDAAMSAAPGGAIETISWSEAVDSVGQRLRVEGVVAGVKRGEAGTELSIGLPAPAPQRFVVIVPDKVAERFDAPLSDLFEGMLVRATGTIVKIGDHTGVRIERPSELKPAQ
jgi:hypothetical protein